MNEHLSVLDRIAESSPVIVLILIVACTVLWKTLREEMREWRAIASRNTDAVHALTVAVDRLRERIDHN